MVVVDGCDVHPVFCRLVVVKLYFACVVQSSVINYFIYKESRAVKHDQVKYDRVDSRIE